MRRDNVEQQFIKSLVATEDSDTKLHQTALLQDPPKTGSPSCKWRTVDVSSTQSSNSRDEKPYVSLNDEESAREFRAYLSPTFSQTTKGVTQSCNIPRHGVSCREQSHFSEKPAKQLAVLTSNFHESDFTFQSSHAELGIVKSRTIPKRRVSHRHLSEQNAHLLETVAFNRPDPNGATSFDHEPPPSPKRPGALPYRGERTSLPAHLDGTPDQSSSPRLWSFWKVLTKEQQTDLPADPTVEGMHTVPEDRPISFTQLKAESSCHSSPRILENTKTSTDSSIRHPCRISEDMVQCMIDIYCYLSDTSGDSIKPSQFATLSSPASTLGHAASSSFSSISESSLLSFIRSPTIDLQNTERILGSETTYDPYKAYEKVPWADVGVYGSAVEVLSISVGKEQLKVAAMALSTYKIFVEELSKTDLKSMTNKEKLAFWINIYNALVMHAFLAYGIPKSETKFFSMLQKATYVVGGRLLSAITIEFGLLKRKAPAHRPQMALLLAFHRLRLMEEDIMDGIDHPEPLTMFALCSGSYSSPAVRVYTAEKVMEQLQESFHDYIRASVSIDLRGKLLIPKLLYIYAHASVEDAALVDWICNHLPNSQSSLIQDCMQQRQTQLLRPKKFKVISFDIRFRYLFLSTARRTTYIDLC